MMRGDWQAALAPYQHSQRPPNTPVHHPPTTTLPATPPNTTAPGIHEASARVQAPGGRTTRAPSAPPVRVWVEGACVALGPAYTHV